MRESHCKSAAHDATQSTTELLVYSTLWGFVATPVGNDPLFNHVVLSWKELSRSKETLDDHSSSCTCAQRDLLEIDQLLNCPGRVHLRPAHFLLLWPPPRFSSLRYLAVATPEACSAAQCVHKDQRTGPSVMTALHPRTPLPLHSWFWTKDNTVPRKTNNKLWGWVASYLIWGGGEGGSAQRPPEVLWRSRNFFFRSLVAICFRCSSSNPHTSYLWLSLWFIINSKPTLSLGVPVPRPTQCMGGA